MKSLDKEFTKFVKTNNHNLDIILPVILGLLILFFIIVALINKKKRKLFK
jgi:mannose/fructose/N-acetylgalactosamine-specific phosphotransferase system component IID